VRLICRRAAFNVRAIKFWEKIMTEEVFPDWDRNTRMPTPAPPAGSCDCQFHIFHDDLAKYPAKPDALYQPLKGSSFDDAQGMLKAMGFSRGVIVHAMPYDTDHSLLIDTLAALSPEARRNTRATAIIKDSVSDATLERLNALGVRGARFNVGRKYAENTSLETVRRSMDRAREIGWHAKLHINGDDVLDFADFLMGIKNLTMVIDHMAHLHFADGFNQAPFLWILERLKQDENWWMLCSNGNRDSKFSQGFDDAVPYGAAFIAAAPDRMVWGSDWPHVRWRKDRMMNDAEAVELLYRYVDNDAALIKKVLVDNPARLYGFE
jgi:2-pyrone-4,6-dicarboxylate lactonase